MDLATTLQVGEMDDTLTFLFIGMVEGFLDIFKYCYVFAII